MCKGSGVREKHDPSGSSSRGLTVSIGVRVCGGGVETETVEVRAGAK